MTVNFDNAATTFPKPPSVAAAVFNAVKHYGGNAGRGGHKGTDNRIREIFIEGVWTSIRYVLLCVSMMMHMQQRRSGTSGG